MTPPVEIAAEDYNALQGFLFLALAMLTPMAFAGLIDILTKKPK